MLTNILLIITSIIGLIFIGLVYKQNQRIKLARAELKQLEESLASAKRCEEILEKMNRGK